MEYCLDTGDLEMVKKVVDLYPVRCFSMNPSIAVRCLKGTGRTFLENARMIREVIGEEYPFYLEAMGDTAEEMIAVSYTHLIPLAAASRSVSCFWLTFTIMALPWVSKCVNSSIY